MATDLLSLVQKEASKEVASKEVEVEKKKEINWILITRDLKEQAFPELEQKLQHLRKLQGESLVPYFDEEEQLRKEQELQKERQLISNEIRKVHQLLKNLSFLPLNLAEASARDQQVQFFTKKLQYFVTSLTSIEHKMVKKLEERDTILGTNKEEPLGELLLKNKQMFPYTNNLQNIVRDIQELNQLFLDMALLVDQQGIMLTEIEGNVQRSVVNMEKGTVELKKASVLQKKGKKKLCILLLCICFFIGIAILIIKLSIF